jgi:hypothetical protein
MAAIRSRTKINSSDPPLTAVRTAYASEPLLPFFHPPMKLASFQPCGRLYVDGRVDLSAICCGMLLHLFVAEIHIRLEHAYDSSAREPHGVERGSSYSTRGVLRL